VNWAITAVKPPIIKRMIKVFEANNTVENKVKSQNRLQNRHASMLKPVLELSLRKATNDGKDK
jgi:hypothetical protein